MTITRNTFGESSHTTVLFMFLMYTCLGTVAVLSSLLDILVFIVNRDSRNRYLLFIVLDFAEIIDGIAYIMCGYGRGKEYHKGLFNTAISFHDCFFTKNWVIPLIIGTELPALITIIISIERITAVMRPKLYAIFWRPKVKLLLTVAAIVVQLISILFAGLSAFNNTELSGTRHCAIINSTSTVYSTTHFLFVVLAYILSFASLLIVEIMITRRCRGKEAKTVVTHKGPQTKLLLCVTGAAIVLVAMPSVVMISIRLKMFTVNDIALAITYSGPGILTIATTVINFIFRPEYRQQLYKLLRIKQKDPLTNAFSVKTVNVSYHKR
uniref:G-protein coupled receptors family 1 profile domain-containing protein n=1 Tax=Ascaris lumbricoides TaxID=6252 RepID=A0A9J2Q3I4_ASCLU